jgi:lantibiotic modifying enzyme
MRGRLTGCAHGAAGIAHALARVAGATGDARYLDAAGGAVAFEEELFDAAVGNWPDLRRDAPEGSFMLGWCSGAPGVGLARLSSVKTVAQSSIDVGRAARATQTAGLGRRDHLCCGNFGRAAFLFEAARQLDDHELHAAAANLVRAAVDRAETSGTFALVSDASAQADHVGFFQGTAGIGFQLLRFAYPDLLPSPLLIE